MTVSVHRCRFMDYERPGISAMAFNLASVDPKSAASPDLRLAVGRSNGDIEIWNPHDFVCETVIPGALERSVEDLCWVRTQGTYRLFSVGGTDTVVEWDLATGLPLQFARSDAGVVWALAPSSDEQTLAVSTESGHIVLFDISDGSLEYSKRLGGADTSLASVAWQSPTVVVAGGEDGAVRVWDINQNRILATLRVDKQKRRAKPGTSSAEDTVVWAVLSLPRTHQLVTGDSNGFVKIWDTRTWSLQQSLQAHEGDVLSLASNWNGTSLFSSGLDQKIVNSKLTDQKLRRWTVMTSAVAHTHDIRCMASHEAGKLSLLVSGGLEPAFVVSDMRNFVSSKHRKVATAPFQPQADIQGDHIVEWREKTAAVWQIADTGRRLRAKVKVAGDEYLTCASFDPELGLLALGTLYSLRLFLVDGSDVVPVPLQNWDEETGCRLLKWAEPEKLVVVTDADKCIVYDTGSGATVTVAEPGKTPQNKLPYTNRVALLAVCEGFVALARHGRHVEVYTLTGKHVASLPALPAEPTAISFRGPRNLIVATADRAVTDFDTVSGQLTPWSRLNQGRMPPQLTAAAEPAHGIFTGVGKADRAWLWGPSWLATIDFSSTKPLRKRRNPADDEDDDDEEVDVAVVEDTASADDLPAFWMSHKYKPLFFAGALGSGVLVSERPDSNIGTKRFWSNRRIQI